MRKFEPDQLFVALILSVMMIVLLFFRVLY